MAEHLEIGKKGEELANNYLQRNGFKILERNWRVKHFEIDIIAEKDAIIHFIEVKTRKKKALLSARESLSYKKQKNLEQAVAFWFQQNPTNTMPAQFDFIAITHNVGNKNVNEYEIEYYANYTQA